MWETFSYKNHSKLIIPIPPTPILIWYNIKNKNQQLQQITKFQTALI